MGFVEGMVLTLETLAAFSLLPFIFLAVRIGYRRRPEVADRLNLLLGIISGSLVLFMLMKLATPVPRGSMDIILFRLVHLAPRLLGRSERTIWQDGFDILARVTREPDLEIMNRGRAVHGECGCVSAMHQADQCRREPALDHMSADTPDDAALLLASRHQRVHYRSQRIGGKQLRQPVEPRGERRAGSVRLREQLRIDFAAAPVK